MAVELRKLSVEDLATFPDDGYRYEIIDGDLLMSPAPSKKHQRVLGRLFRLFAQAVEDSNLGEVFFSPVDVRFSDDDQVQPDLIFIRKERRGIYRESTVHGAPDIVVEVLSPGTRSYDEVVKLRLFEAHGVPEYWIVDPISNKIRRFELRNAEYVEAGASPDQSFSSSVLPGLRIDPSELFRDADE